MPIITTNKPFTTKKLNTTITGVDKKEKPVTGSQGASSLPVSPLVSKPSTDSSEPYYPDTPGATFRSNMMNTTNNGIIMLNQFSDLMSHGSITVWDDEPHNLFQHTKTAQQFKIQTKDFDFGDPSRRKKIYKVYVTFRCNYTAGNKRPSGVIMKYATNGSTSFTGTFSDDDDNYYDSKGFTAYNSTDWITVGLKPSSSINNVYSIALQFSYADQGRVNQLAANSSSGTNEVTLDSGSGAGGAYLGMPIYFFKGPGAGNIHQVTAFNGTSKVAQIQPVLTADVTTGTNYDVGFIPASFSINDISIIYREKSIK
tara:strand:+ start:489 stop:1424 length:936 start_codon:yes stop_codon:yes gene_type:complete